MDRNFAKSLKLVLKYEGGYVNDKDDPGGATNKGITLATFRRYIKPNGSIADLKAITDQQVATIYRKKFWNEVDADALPDGVDFAVFDYAVNSGPSRARRVAKGSIDEICDKRMAFLETLPTFRKFGKGWTNRVIDVRKNAHAMAVGKPASAIRLVDAPSPVIEPKPTPAPVPVTDKEMIQRVQTGLKLLNYNPGSADGVIGPLTAGAIRVFRADNGLPEGDFIDDALIAALASAKPREMIAARANATQGQVASAVPEANVHWWNRIGATIVGGGAAAGGAVDYIAPATGYLQPVRDFLGDIPAWAWIIGIVAIAFALYQASAYGSKKATEAYQSGDRR